MCSLSQLALQTAISALLVVLSACSHYGLPCSLGAALIHWIRLISSCSRSCTCGMVEGTAHPVCTVQGKHQLARAGTCQQHDPEHQHHNSSLYVHPAQPSSAMHSLGHYRQHRNHNDQEHSAFVGAVWCARVTRRITCTCNKRRACTQATMSVQIAHCEMWRSELKWRYRKTCVGLSLLRLEAGMLSAWKLMLKIQSAQEQASGCTV